MVAALGRGGWWQLSTVGGGGTYIDEAGIDIFSSSYFSVAEVYTRVGI